MKVAAAAVALLAACGGASGEPGADAETGGGGPGGPGGGPLVPVGGGAPPEPEPEAPAAPCAGDDDCPKTEPYCLPPGTCVACFGDLHCDVWERCEGGACLPRVCKPGQGLCKEDDLFTCAASGEAWDLFACAPGTCAPEGCEACPPGHRICDGATVLECDAAGAGYTSFATCTGGKVCAGGQCLECLSPGVVDCKDGRVVTCGTFGFWQIAEDCKAKGFECSNGACVDCAPSDLGCSGDVQVCFGPDGQANLEDCAEHGLMCWQGGCFPKCKDHDFKTGFVGFCGDGVCCAQADGDVFVTGLDSCPGEIVPWHVCQVPVCCALPSGVTIEMGAGACKGGGGELVSSEICGEEICCQTAPGVFETKPRGSCWSASGPAASVAAGVWCEFETCCLGAGGEALAVAAKDCLAAGGAPVPGPACNGVPQVVTVAVPVALDPEEVCDYLPYLVVPSSFGDALVVYDLETLEVFSGPFPVCSNPSRVVFEPTTDVLVSCRGDGHAMKTTLTGDVLWDVQLPGCNLSRGIARSADGRVFASCWNPGRIWELEPETGEPIPGKTVGVPIGVYGMAVDATGIYVAGFGVSRIVLGGESDLTVSWSGPLPAYGIAADGHGVVWLGGSLLTSIDGPTGAVLGSWDVGGFVHGVTVGPGGRIWAAVPGADRVAALDPGSGKVVDWEVPLAGAFPKGVGVDAFGNAYVIEYYAEDVVRLGVDGTTTTFGGGALSYPYAYNGDLTGFSPSCVAANSATFVSEPIDAGGLAAWLDVTWDGETPEGAEVHVSYRLDDEAGWVGIPQSGAVLAVVGEELTLQVVLATNDPDAVPSVGAITLRYVPLEAPEP